jgi:hypothetical protein
MIESTGYSYSAAGALSRRQGSSRSAPSPTCPIGRPNSSKVGAVISRHKMAKHFELVIAEASFSFHRKDAAIAAEALDSIYVVRTNQPRTALGAAAAAGAYKSLARVEHAFRSLKTVDINLRPDLPLDRAPGAYPRPAVHACLPCRTAQVRQTRSDALCRGQSRCRRRNAHERRCSGGALQRLPGASRRPVGPTTVCRYTASRACSPISPPNDHRAQREIRLHSPHQANPDPAARLRALAIYPDRKQ